MLGGGVFGTKIFMVCFSSFVIYLTWNITNIFTQDRKIKFFITILCCISANVIPHAGQIFPDLPSGIIALYGLYILINKQYSNSIISEIILISSISYLPWIHIKLIPTCIILAAAISLKKYHASHNRINCIYILSASIISCISLLLFNYYCFDKISGGDYSFNPIEISKTSFMVLLGLLMDQNQGFLFQNPVYFAGILGIGGLWHYNRPFTVIWLLVFLSLIVPNGMHPAWYGGWCFAGRYQLSAAIVFIIPTIFFLSKLAESKTRLFQYISIIAIGLQTYFFYIYAVNRANLYLPPPPPRVISIDDYSIYYYPFAEFLPALYNSAWAYTYIQNYIWFCIIILFLLYGIFLSHLNKIKISWDYAK
jgi:hypothetical protein